MRLLTLEEGTFAVRYARAVIENYLAGKKIVIESYPEVFNEKGDVFAHYILIQIKNLEVV